MTKERDWRKPYPIDIDLAEKILRGVNAKRMFLVEDYAVANVFRQLMTTRSAEFLPACVVILDALWKTRMYEIETEREAVCRSLEKHWSMILQTLDGMKEFDIGSVPTGVFSSAQDLFPLILQAEGRLKRNYSFCTKFFHWTTRVHFPIVDAFSRKSVNRLQVESGDGKDAIKADATTSPAGNYVDEYFLWVTFYSGLMNSIPATDGERLVKADYDSQGLPERMENTLLRALDKILYASKGRHRLAAGS